MEILNKYNKWDENLWREYDETFKDARYTITDGVVSPEDYYNSAVKIMFLNREPYDEKSQEYSLNEALREEIDTGAMIFEKQTTMRPHMRDDMAMAALLERDITKLTDEDVQREHDRWDNDMFQQRMYSCAYVNVKKSDGQLPSSVTDLRYYAEKGVATLKKQIEYFNPTLIFGGNVVYKILDNALDWGETLYASQGVINVYEIKINGRVYPIFDLYHPSATSYSKGSMSDYYWEIYKAMRQIAEERPGYWAKRINQSCFL